MFPDTDSGLGPHLPWRRSMLSKYSYYFKCTNQRIMTHGALITSLINVSVMLMLQLQCRFLPTSSVPKCHHFWATMAHIITRDHSLLQPTELCAEPWNLRFSAETVQFLEILFKTNVFFAALKVTN